MDGLSFGMHGRATTSGQLDGLNFGMWGKVFSAGFPPGEVVVGIITEFDSAIISTFDTNSFIFREYIADSKIQKTHLQRSFILKDTIFFTKILKSLEMRSRLEKIAEQESGILLEIEE